MLNWLSMAFLFFQSIFPKLSHHIIQLLNDVILGHNFFFIDLGHNLLVTLIKDCLPCTYFDFSSYQELAQIYPY